MTVFSKQNIDQNESPKSIKFLKKIQEKMFVSLN